MIKLLPNSTYYRVYAWFTVGLNYSAGYPSVYVVCRWIIRLLNILFNIFLFSAVIDASCSEIAIFPVFSSGFGGVLGPGEVELILKKISKQKLFVG